MTEFRVWAPLAKTVELSLPPRRLAMSPDDDRGWWHLDATTGMSDAPGFNPGLGPSPSDAPGFSPGSQGRHPGLNPGASQRGSETIGSSASAAAVATTGSPLPAGRRAGGEVDYAFFVDGEGPFPDPRSPWQPSGVDGLSRTVDHDAFEWQHDDWPDVALADAVIYELHIGTFTPGGTFESAIERLDHLVELGVTHVEVMPVAHFSGERGWGYDGVDLYAPHQAYGGPAGLKRFVDACHGRGLRVLLDVVYNHLGPAGNYTERFGPYFTERYHTPWGKALNYDQAYSDEVRRWVLDNVTMWLRDYRFDGLRLDAVHAILDQSARHILEDIELEVRVLEHRTGRNCDIIAESDLNDPKLVAGWERGGYGLAAAWSDDFHHALHALLTGETAGYYEDFGRMSDLTAVLTRVFVFDGWYSTYRHRSHGRAVIGLPATKFVFAAQNHDQVGNRAMGERLEHLVGPRRAKVAAAVLLTAPGVPLLFQGEEWAASSPFQYFTAHEDPALGKAVSQGRRREFAAFGWEPSQVPDPQDPATFERSRLNWDEIAGALESSNRAEPAPSASVAEPIPPAPVARPTPSGVGSATSDRHAGMLAWYRDLIALRRSTPDLRDGNLRNVRVLYDEAGRWLSMTRGSITTALNLAPHARDVPIPPGSRILLTSDRETHTNRATVHLPPDTVVILTANSPLAAGEESPFSPLRQRGGVGGGV